MKLSGRQVDPGSDGAVGPYVGHEVGLEVPGPQPGPGHHVHQGEVLGLVVVAGDALQAVCNLPNVLTRVKICRSAAIGSWNLWFQKEIMMVSKSYQFVCICYQVVEGEKLK